MNFKKVLKYMIFIAIISIPCTMVFAAETECSFVLGETTNPESFAYLLNQAFKLIQVLGPVLTIVVTVLDLIKALTSSEKDALNKLINKTIKRLIFAVLLFAIPAVLDTIFKWVGIYGVCGIGM